jgi:hypothetical protein
VALAGKDGQQAAELLESTKAAGVRLLAAVASAALARLLRDGGADAVRRARRLLNDPEREALAAGFAAALATGELLGRARVRLRARQAEQRHAAGGASAFSEEPTDFHVFTGGLRPMPPKRALEYFRSLVPTLDVKAGPFVAGVRGRAFTVAGITEESLLARIKDVVAGRLETGQALGTAPAEIRAVLEEAGLAGNNVARSEMIFRTSTMDAYNTGSTEEMRHPDVAETFPAWRYLGIADGRQGADHAPHFDKLYPNRATFAAVRGGRIFNCRCSSQPVSKYELPDLLAAGRRVETSW